LHELLDSVVIYPERIDVLWSDIGWDNWPKRMELNRATNDLSVVGIGP